MKTIKKILKALNVIAAYSIMFALMFGAWQTLSAQTPVTPDLSGRWTIAYEGGSPDVYVTLFVSSATAEHPMDELSGIYHDGAGGICPVKGAALGNVFNLTVVCSKDQTELNGNIQPDGTTITGTFKLGMESGRTFRMEKMSCWIPEGCGKPTRPQVAASRS